MTPENMEMTLIFVQEALDSYEHLLNSSESIGIEERKKDKLLGVKSDDYEAKQSLVIPNEEDNETTSYI